MLFGVVGRLGARKKKLDRLAIAAREGAILAVHMGRPIVTSGNFVA